MVYERKKLHQYKHRVDSGTGSWTREPTKNVVSRLESSGKYKSSLSTLKKYARRVGCRLEIKLIPIAFQNIKTLGLVKKRATV
jgi:hypothetical protein